MVGYHNKTGLTLLKVTEPPKNIGFVNIFDGNDSLQVGSSLITISYKKTLPLAPRWSVFMGTTGMGNVNLKSIKKSEIFLFPVLRTQLTSFGGESGSPVFDTNGSFIGFTYMYNEASRENLILPQKAIIRYVKDLKVFGKVQYAWIGVTIFENSLPIQIKEVVQGSPSDIAGLKAGDIILELGDKRIDSLLDMSTVIFYSRIGTVLPITINRDGKKKIFELNIKAKE